MQWPYVTDTAIKRPRANVHDVQQTYDKRTWVNVHKVTNEILAFLAFNLAVPYSLRYITVIIPFCNIDGRVRQSQVKNLKNRQKAI